LPSTEFTKISLLGKGGFAAVFKVSLNEETIALKQTSKTNNYKADTDIFAAKNELELQTYILSM